VARRNSWGLIDATGKVLLEPQSDYPVDVWGQSASVRKGNSFTQVPLALDPNPEKAAVLAPTESIQERDGKKGLVDGAGKTLIPFKWENIEPVASGIFLCENGSERALINRKGEIVFRDTRDARVAQPDEKSSFARPIIFIERPPLWGYARLKSASPSHLSSTAAP
jgi:hypothetical protein